MANRNSRSSRFQNQRVRNRAWTGSFETALVSIPANSAVLLSGFVPQNPGIDLTILRTVGEIFVSSDNAAASETQVGAVGMIIVTDDAFAVGITAIPDPVASVFDDGWFMFQSFAQKTTFLSSIGFNDPSGMKYSYDSKAKRILEGAGKTIVIVAANAHATEGFNLLLNTRILTQLRN